MVNLKFEWLQCTMLIVIGKTLKYHNNITNYYVNLYNLP